LGAADNFVESAYTDQNGRERPMILISEIALPLVLGYLGGPVYAPIVIAHRRGLASPESRWSASAFCCLCQSRHMVWRRFKTA
jgi:hypothetical protein